ncbi:hypothetical protein CEXT_362711 [Caerostris extrusa]|uniref:Uncharacterized protein n=1 Tax=Caerostris extrusa TaxID=172846 RepID=A0AAV4PLP1_CAEEX|nr:hypothetical protein CEXT_362711 [Caerostris extrusa]
MTESRNLVLAGLELLLEMGTNVSIPLNEKTPLHEVCLQDKSKRAETARPLDVRIEIPRHSPAENKKDSSKYNGQRTRLHVELC